MTFFNKASTSGRFVKCTRGTAQSFGSILMNFMSWTQIFTILSTLEEAKGGIEILGIVMVSL